MKKLLLGLGLWLALAASAAAQNVQCPDRPATDSSNACANTRFVGTYVGANAVSQVASIAALKAKAAGYATSVYVESYYAAGFEGGGLFNWNSSSAAADDGGAVIQPNSLPATGRWIRDTSPPMNVVQWGAKCDASDLTGNTGTEDYYTFTAALAYVNSIHGGVMNVPPRLCKIGATLTLLDYNFVQLVGAASNTNYGVSLGRTSGLVWGGALGGKLMSLTPTDDISHYQSIGNGVSNLAFWPSTARAAAIGLELLSQWGGAYSGLYFGDFTTASLDADTTLNTASPAGGIARNTFTNITVFNNAASAIGFRLGMYNGGFFFNTLTNLVAYVQNGTGIQLGNSDNNVFTNVQGTTAGRVVGYDVELTVNTHGPLSPVAANNNHFNTFAATSVCRASTYSNTFDYVDDGNHFPAPVLDGTGQCNWTFADSGNVTNFTSGISSIIAQKWHSLQANATVKNEISNSAQIWRYGLDGSTLNFYLGTNTIPGLFQFYPTGDLGIIGNLSATQLQVRGASSGVATIVAQAAAGTPTLTLPTATGTFVSTATSPLAISATTGQITCSTCLTNTPAALTKTDDTNVTLTLGGTPSTALLQAVSVTVGWTGTLAVARGGTGLGSGTSGGILGYTASGTLASSIALTANALVLGGGAGATPTPMGSLGTTTTVLHGNAAGAPTFAAIANADLGTMVTNTVKGNATSGTATPTDLAVGTCSTAASALKWTTNTGFGCNTSIDAATLGGATFAAPGAIGGGTPSTGAFTTLTASTSLTSPLHTGGSAVGSGAEIRSTSATGTTDFIKFTVGTNGATEAARFSHLGHLLIGSATDQGSLYINNATAGITLMQGTGVAGNFIIDYQASGVSYIDQTQLNIRTFAGVVVGAFAAGGLTIPTTANAATTSALCFNTGSGLVTYNSTVGTCTVSTLRAKDLEAPLTPQDGFDLVMAMRPWIYTLKKGLPTYTPGEQIGFVAEEAWALDHRLAAINPDGSVAGVRYEQYTAALTAAIQYLKADNDNLREEFKKVIRR